MVFRGVYPAPELEPAPFGLLSVARVMKHTAREYDERWVRGFSYEFDSQMTLSLLTLEDVEATDGEIYNAEGDIRFREYVPFGIEVEDFRSIFSITGEDRLRRVLTQLEAATQKAVEFELWSGAAAQEATNSNAYLRKEGAASLVNGTSAASAARALAYLEGALADSPSGAGGVIHVTRDVASLLGSEHLYRSDDTLTTMLGTPVVVGSGYSGDGPINVSNTTATLTNKWMYGTGPVDVHLGKPELMNENLAQGADVTINDMRIKAVRPAAAYFDPSCHFAVRVDLTA